MYKLIPIASCALLLTSAAAAQTPAELFKRQQKIESQQQSNQDALYEFCRSAVAENKYPMYSLKNNREKGSYPYPGSIAASDKDRYIVFPINSKTSIIAASNSDKKVIYEYTHHSKDKCKRIAMLDEVTITKTQECKTFSRVAPVNGTYQSFDVYWNPFTVKGQWVQENNGNVLSFYQSYKVGSCPKYILESHQQDPHISAWNNSFSPGTSNEKFTFPKIKFNQSTKPKSKWQYLNTIKGLKYYFAVLPSDEKGVLKFEFRDGNDSRYSDIDIKCPSKEFRRTQTDNKWLKISSNKGDLINMVYTKSCQ